MAGQAVTAKVHALARCCWCGRAFVWSTVKGVGVWLCPNEPCWQRQVKRAISVSLPGKPDQVLYVPLPSQVKFDECEARNVLWGGQAGPGKSHGARWWLYKRSLTVPGHTSLLLRENWDELKKTHLRFMEVEVPKLGGRFHVSDRMATFANGSIIDCGHMADAEAVSRYLSTEYGAIVPDEASRYPVDSEGTTPLAELSTRARKVYVDQHGVDVKPRFMPVTNPGGPSAQFLKEFFIDHEPDWDRYPKELREEYDPAEWAYVPASLDENPYQDESYRKTLMILSPWRYEQLAKGNWEVFGGQFFGEWRPSHHVRHLDCAKDLMWFASIDWGFNAPGVCLWWVVLPDGHLHVAREFKFQSRPVEVVAAEIQAINRTMGIRLRYLAADPAMWQKTGHGRGESVAETLQRYQLPAVKADNDRFNGWLRVHEILRDAPDGTPWLTVDPECRYLVRSLPAQMSDPKDPDDVNTGGDDHAVDALRYGAMSRPVPSAKSLSQARTPGTWGWWKNEANRKREADGILTRRR